MSAIPRPPGPRSRYPFENVLRFRRDILGFLQEASRHGDIAYFKAGLRDVYLISRPELIQDVLVTRNSRFVKSLALQMAKAVLGEGLLTSEGARHLRQRRLIQPVFHAAAIRQYAGVMADLARRLTERWEDGAAVDMHREMMRLTLSIAAKTLFGADVESEAEDIGEALTEVMKGFYRVMNPFAPLLDRLPLPSNRRFDRALARIDATVYRMIRDRRESAEDRGDLLSRLLSARDEEGDGAGMSDRQVRDEAVTLLLAGHETTANALTWSWYLLSRNEDAEGKLCEEVDAVVGDRPVSAEDIDRLDYTRRVFAESLRLYPPAYSIGRENVVEHRLDQCPVPPRSTILMSQFIAHRDARYFTEPERFDPDRWLPEAVATRSRFSYFPFGGGPRVCIGESFAWMEGIVVLATLARRFRARLVPGRSAALLPLLTLRPRDGMPMTLHRR